MDNGIVSVRYAKALLRFAVANKEEEIVYKEMTQLTKSFIETAQLRAIILNPTLSFQQVKDVIVAAAAATSQSFVRFVEVLQENKRLALLQFVATSYLTLFRQERGLVTGKLTMATTPSKEIVDRMEKLVASRTDAKVDFEVNVDPSVMGGFILEYDTYRLDTSIRNRLSELKRSLL